MAGRRYKIISASIRNMEDQDESVNDDICRRLYADDIVYDDQKMHLLLVNIMEVRSERIRNYFKI